jgi:hypothetical protein
MNRNKHNRYSLTSFINCQIAAIAVYVRQIPNRKNKSLLLFGFFALCTITFLLTPQKAEAIVFNDIAEWGRNAASKVSQNQEKIVQRYFGQYNASFAYLCYCCQGFAIFPLSIGFMKWLKEDDDLKIWIELVAPVVVFIGLANGGYILGQIILALYKIFDGVINTFDSYTGFYQTIKEGKARALIGPSLSPLFKQCEALIGAEQSACFADLSNQVQNMGDEYKQDFINSSWLQDWLGNINEAMEQWNDPQKNVGEKARTVFWTITSPAWEGILAIILSKVTEAWQALYGIAFIFTGIAAPMAATASLFTSNTFLASAYALWLTGTFTIFLARLLLYIGYGLASDLMVSADASVDTIWFGVVMALVIPFCVFEIAKGGGAGVWSSLVGTASAAISVGTTLAGAAVGGSAGAAAASKVSTTATSSAPPQNNVSVETKY